MRRLVIPILMIAFGTGWLLTTQQVIPGVDWVWVISLATCGVLVLLAGGIDKVTFVVGPFMIAGGLFAFLRQTNRLSANAETPILVILVGVLMLLSQMLRLRNPSWLTDDMAPGKKD